MIKLTTSAAALSIAATSAFAGGYVAPVVDVEPIAVEESAASSNAGWIVPAALLLTVVAVVASDSDDKQPDDVGNMPKPMTTDVKMGGIVSNGTVSLTPTGTGTSAIVTH